MHLEIVFRQPVWLTRMLRIVPLRRIASALASLIHLLFRVVVRECALLPTIAILTFIACSGRGALPALAVMSVEVKGCALSPTIVLQDFLVFPLTQAMFLLNRPACHVFLKGRGALPHLVPLQECAQPTTLQYIIPLLLHTVLSNLVLFVYMIWRRRFLGSRLVHGSVGR